LLLDDRTRRVWSVYLCGLTDARRTPVEPAVISTKQFVAHAAYVCLSVCLDSCTENINANSTIELAPLFCSKSTPLF